MALRSTPHARQWRETGPYVSDLASAPLHDALVALGARQHTVFALWQVRQLGLSPDAVRRRVARRRLFRIHHAVYSLVPRELLSRQGHWMAAVLACGPDAVLSHRTAAALHEIRPTLRTNIDVTVRGSSHRKHKGIDLHRSTTLTDDDVTVIDGIPTTSVARTAIDLAAVVSRRATERAFDQMEMADLFDLAAITDQLARNPYHRGAPVVHSVLAEHYIGSTVTASELEETVLAICRHARIPEPLVNRWLDLGDGGPLIKADFLWPEQRVIVESDGDSIHRTRQARERDTRRDQRATLAGWRLMRVTHHQAKYAAQELEATLVRLVRAPQPPPLRAAAG